MRFAVRLAVSPLPGMRSPEGETVETALHALGFGGVAQVTVGKLFEWVVEADSAARARADAQAMVDALLANPVSERAEILDVRETGA